MREKALQLLSEPAADQIAQQCAEEIEGHCRRAIATALQNTLDAFEEEDEEPPKRTRRKKSPKKKAPPAKKTKAAAKKKAPTAKKKAAPKKGPKAKVSGVKKVDEPAEEPEEPTKDERRKGFRELSDEDKEKILAMQRKSLDNLSRAKKGNKEGKPPQPALDI